MTKSKYRESNMKKVSKYLEVNETPLYTQLKNTNISNLLNPNFIIKFLDERVNDGELSKITIDNLPYIYSYRKVDLERKVKIQKMINSFNIQLSNYNTISLDNIEYKAVLYETGVIKKCGINNEPKLLDSDLKKILTFCKENGISHIYEICEKRFGIEVNKVHLSLNNILTINNFDDYGIYFDNGEYIKHLAYVYPEYDEKCSDMNETSDDCYYDSYVKDKYYDIDVNSLKHSENSIKDCYVFNEVSYTVSGIKTYPKDTVNEFTLCKLDFEYFYNKYVNKK